MTQDRNEGGVELADRRDPALQAMARNALDFAVKEKFADAVAAMGRINARYGGDGGIQAALLWIDYLAAHHGAKPNSAGVAFLLKAVETGAISPVTDQRPTVVWAGRLIAARLADDESTFVALINAVGKRPDFGSYIGELLHMVALSLKHGAVLGPTGRAAVEE